MAMLVPVIVTAPLAVILKLALPTVISNESPALIEKLLPTFVLRSVSYTHLTLPTIYSV